ncbi:Transmembrane emp24 domain-containing protein 2, partial [Fragariocoptes setiger]
MSEFSIPPLLLSLVVVLSLYTIQPGDALMQTIDAHAEECFFERAEAGTKLGFTFEVIDGGFLDIDIHIRDPEGRILHQEERASSGKYTIEATTTGAYDYCFSNKMSTMTPKVVMFSIEKSDGTHISSKPGDAADEEHAKLQSMVQTLVYSGVSVKRELEYMAVRDRIHRRINEETNSRVLTWSLFEFVLFLTASVAQVVYLKRFFEVKRVI